MFIRTELMRKIKEVIFKKRLHEELDTWVSIEAKDLTSDMVNKNINKLSNLEHIKGHILSSGENNLYDLMRDLLNVVKGSKNYSFLSEFGNELANILLIVNTNVKQAFDNSSDVTKEVASELAKLSKNSVLVGGCVRDAILRDEPKDWDFATDAHYDDVEKTLTKAGFKIKEAGKQFLVMIVSKDGEDFEVAMFRKDGSYSDGRRPESVEIGTIFDDAQRRDLTINALYYNICTEEVQDPNGTGLKDLQDMILRFVGNASDRIQEDYLRVMRFYRFLGRFKHLGMKSDSKSLKACRTNFSEMQKKVAPERMKNEIEKMVGL